MKVAEALIELQRLKRTRDLFRGLIDAASTEEGNVWGRRERRTTDTVLRRTYPGIEVNRLRERRDELDAQIRRLETRIQRTNWGEGDPPLAELLREAKRLDEEENQVYAEARRYIRLYEDEVAHAPDVAERIQRAEELIRLRAETSRRIQRLNWEVDVG
ncbi:DIP1984 family protein [Limnochorda pilosa]|uniref:Uncharacterized protein n=1 Tax=Limnochorda pilosa TaxID=1555112 RepID=A0A0K2SM55_LIMPI|nr:hypothetical protein [Limnochorda pilosa]BAS28185.1 hypothetical protein LIP_2344 [Limnochorda pilosa]